MSVAQPYNYGIDAVARSTGAVPQNMFCASIADNAENPTFNQAQASLTATNAANTAIPAALFAVGTGLYYVSYTVTASGLSQGGVGRVTKSGSAITGVSGFGTGLITAAGAAGYLQLVGVGGVPCIQNATGNDVNVSVIVSKIAA
jgi:hypothetical protein